MKKTSNTVTASKAASTKVAAKKTSTNSNASSKKKKEQEIIFPEPRIDFVTLFEAFKIYSKFRKQDQMSSGKAPHNMDKVSTKIQTKWRSFRQNLI